MLVLLGLAQWYSAAHHYVGPLTSLAEDFTGNSSSATMPWAGLALALVGLPARRRFAVAGLAAAIDLAFFAVRGLHGESYTLGTGPTLVLCGLVLYAALRWRGYVRRTALHAAALGVLLILATKVGNTWLELTGELRPTVLDRYVVDADRALGEPSWLMGRFFEATKPVVPAVLHWVYIELPVAAMVVAVWQLRNVARDAWPRHYLVRTFLVLGLVGPLVYLLFPVVGPVYAFGSEGHGMQLGDFWPDVAPPTGGDPAPMPFDPFTPRNCMPSMHTAWALTVFVHSRRGPWWLRGMGAFWLIGTVCATLGFGYHYGCDLIVGATLCMTVESALREPERGWDGDRARMVALGIGAFAVLLLSYRYLPVQLAHYPLLSGALLLGLLAVVARAFYLTWHKSPE